MNDTQMEAMTGTETVHEDVRRKVRRAPGGIHGLSESLAGDISLSISRKGKRLPFIWGFVGISKERPHLIKSLTFLFTFTT